MSTVSDQGNDSLNPESSREFFPGEPPRVFSINPTKGCNYRCKYCYQNHASDSPDLPIVLIADALTEVRREFGPRWISVAGGEPLLYGGLLDLIAHCREVGHQVTICTNGALLTPSMARSLAHWGLTEYVLALDGFEEEQDRMCGPGAFRLAMESIRHMREHAPGVGLGISCLINRSNIPRLLEFVKYVLSLEDVRFLKFQAYVTHPDHVNDRDWLQSDPLWPDDPDLTGRVLDELAAWSRREPRIVDPFDHFRIIKMHFSNPLSFAFDHCLAWKRMLIIENNGEVNYCTKMGAIGNLHDRSFSEIWGSPEHVRVLNKMANCRQACQNLVNCGFAPEILVDDGSIKPTDGNS